MARSELLKNQNFRYLWAGDAFGQFGAQIAGFVLPIIAVQYLHATELQMGILNAAESAAFLVIGLPVGAWVDRMRKRKVLIIADLVRALVLTTLAVLALTGHASIPLLIGVALAVSVCNTFFDVSYQSFVPAVVGPKHLLEGNSKLEAVHSVMYIVGPAIGGILIRVISPVAVLFITVATYLTSAFTMGKISQEEALKPKEDREPLAQEIREGLAWVVNHRVLRRIVSTTASSNFFSNMCTAVLLIFVLRDIGMSTAVWGIVIAVSSAGGLLGAAFADRIGRRIGVMRVLPISTLVWACSALLIPVSGYASIPVAAVLITISMFISNFSIVVYNIAQVTYRQRVCPPHLLGRMNASVRFIVWGVVPLGSLAGGFVAAAIGSWNTIWLALIAGVFTVIPVLPALWGKFEGQAQIEDEARNIANRPS